MLIQTTRWGPIHVSADHVFSFPAGVIGFPHLKQFVLLDDRHDSRFAWLQNLRQADFALCVIDPEQFDLRYPRPGEDPIRVDGPRVVRLVVNVNRVAGRGAVLTVNTQGPLLLCIQDRLGEQRILSERRWSPRAELPLLASFAHA